MGNFLGDVGNANILGTAIEGIKGMSAIQDLETKKRKAAVDDMTLRSMRYKEEQENKQKQQDKMFSPMSVAFPGAKHLGLDKDYIDLVKSRGYPVEERNGEVFAPNEAWDFAKKQTVQDEDLAMKLHGKLLNKTDENMIMLQQQREELAAQGGEKNKDAIAELDKRIASGKNVQSFLITQRHEFQEKKAEAELKKEEHPKTPSYHITPDKDSSTGFSYTNLNDGRKAGEAPAPASANQEEKTDFTTFKAGRPKKPNESSADWNKRVSDEWEAKQDKRAINKTTVTLDVKEKQRQKTLSRSAQDLEAQIGGKDRLDYYYERYVRYKELPPIGMGGNQRWAFFGGAAQWAKDNGFDAISAQLSQMSTQAARTALTNVKKVKAISGVAGETAISHGQTALDIMDKKDRTGSPVLDRWIRGGRKAVVGDPDVTAFDTSVHFFNRELARYLTSMTAGGVMNQKEADDISALVSSNQNPKQFKRNYETAVRLIKQKEQQFKEQEQDLLNEVPGGAGGASRGKEDPWGIRR